ncbi:flagellar hook protein FlgE [Parvibaculum sp.]|uniref:flagellar hook protein FlgE n=1 Tax=Parvibaculum sp. TaxID=2024848 RepID=UPI002B5A2426|nr:flagellar hook protein FlgE [Parvibaculum sp.]HUD51031.1 flagellar hook protein FlgE [Parvibaculum sp.]
MSFFGAMSTAVTGIKAQSSALGYIADNIANSQTTGFKRTEASFLDIVTVASSTNQQPGAVLAQPKYTNSVQGTVSSSSITTNMAINGDGYFIVSKAVGTADNSPVFQDVDYYTRAGDFTPDKNGYLRNSSGYYLQGTPIDPTTGNPAGDATSVIQINKSFLAAKASTTINYQANLPLYPKTPNSDTTVAGSELLQTAAEAASATPPFHNDPTNTSGTPATDGYIQAQDEATFLDRSVTGGSVTAYDASGNAVSVQLRWVKVDNANADGSGTAPGTETWQCFYKSDDSATGTAAKWTNTGQTYTFDSAGNLTPPVTSTTVSNLTVNGDNLGNITLYHGNGGVTAYADTSGTVTVNKIDQDGYAAGELVGLSITDNGRIAGTYSNGKTIDLYQVTLAKFNNPNGLQKIDGAAFAATNESGQAIVGASGDIVGSALEESNVDLSDEFSKLIIAQQAYTANTRVITTADSLIQETLNMKR